MFQTFFMITKILQVSKHITVINILVMTKGLGGGVIYDIYITQIKSKYVALVL